MTFNKDTKSLASVKGASLYRALRLEVYLPMTPQKIRNSLKIRIAVYQFPFRHLLLLLDATNAVTLVLFSPLPLAPEYFVLALSDAF